jgi:hypothetical protein
MLLIRINGVSVVKLEKISAAAMIPENSLLEPMHKIPQVIQLEILIGHVAIA